MPAYDYRCLECDTSFEVRRSMSEPSVEAPCPQGHTLTSRVFTPVAVGGRGGSAAPAPVPAGGGGGGCCGGACCG